MKVGRILSLVSLITLFSVFYVHQQTEIFRLGYEGQKKHALFAELLDKNTVLRYNIQKSASLTRIGTKVMADESFEMPDTRRIVMVGYAKPASGRIRQIKSENLFSRLFEIKRQAEAETTNH